MKTLCITGANGFIGSHVAMQAAAKGYALRLLLRSEPQPAVRDLGARIFRGDVRNDADLAPFLEGADACCTSPASHPLLPASAKTSTRNVEGTKQILRAARRPASSASSTPAARPASDAGRARQTNDEDTVFNLWNASTDYDAPSISARKPPSNSSRKKGVPVMIAQPAAAVGPGDVKPTYTGKLIIDYINRALPGYFDTRHNYVDVRSVAAGHLLVLEKGALGQRYLLCGDDNLLLSEYFALIRELTGVPPPKLKLPLLAVFPLAYACQALFMVTARIRSSASPPPSAPGAISTTRTKRPRPSWATLRGRSKTPCATKSNGS
jgi:dihydroflavonol-4-reductase